MRKSCALMLLAAVFLVVPSATFAAPRDADRDGLPDRWERQNGLSAAKASAAGDPDRDGLRNKREYRSRLNPRRADSDGDGYDDRAELRAGTNPRDSASKPRKPSREPTPWTPWWPAPTPAPDPAPAPDPVPAPQPDPAPVPEPPAPEPQPEPEPPAPEPEPEPPAPEPEPEPEPPAPEPEPDPPTADFSHSPVAPTTGQQVTFDAGPSTCDAAPCSYSWRDVNNGSWPLGSGEELDFTFQNVGSKHVQLTATDARGESDQAVEVVNVAAPTAPPPPTEPPPPPPPPPTEPPPPPTGACDRTATNASTLSSQWSAASAGQTICLAAGDYGTFRGGSKSGVVTVRSQSGQGASMDVDFAGVNNVRVDSVTVDGASIRNASRNVTISNSRFTGIAAISAGAVANANIVLDGNTHVGIDTCSSCWAGRVHVVAEGWEMTGVTVSDSLFDGGNSDGVRADADGVQIVGNEFRNLRDEDPFHSDPVQIYGGERVTIRGNLFVGGGGGPNGDVSAAVMMADGGANNIVEHNVITPGNHAYPLTWYSDSGSIIRHNTFVPGTCNFNIPCGTINLDAKPANDPGVGTVIRDNVLGQIGAIRATYTGDHNLLANQGPGGVGDIRGLPIFSGGQSPTTYAGFRLASNSPGKGAASDGTDIGIP